MPTKVIKTNITDRHIEALQDFNEAGQTYLLIDTNKGKRRERAAAPGLRCRVGRHVTTWLYYADRLLHGHRHITSKTLGHFPDIRVEQARAAAIVEAGQAAAGHAGPGKRAALKVEAAVEQYIEHLREHRSPSHAKNSASVARVHILPDFAGWPLADLSKLPGRVKEWHKKISKKSPVAANKSVRLLRAVYKHAAKLDVSLPARLPSSAVIFNKESRSQRALAPSDFPLWFAQWQKIENPVRQALQMCNLLCGARPGELSKLKWADVRVRERCFLIRDHKTAVDGDDVIRVPLSAAIARELRRARDAARAKKIDSEYVFFARDNGHVVKFDADDLPAWGMMYRRTWRTVAADVGVDELIAHFCLGHRPAGISRGYVSKMILSSGGAMRSAQRRVSQRIESLLTAPAGHRSGRGT